MPQDNSRPSLPDVKHLLTAGGLVAGTLGTLLLGAALQVDPQTIASETPAVITTAPLAGGSLAPAERAAVPGATRVPASNKLQAPPEPPAGIPAKPAPERQRSVEPTPLVAMEASGLSLADRSEDSRRMLSSGKEWTLQFMVTCNDESASRLLQEVGDDPRLFMLPLSLNDRPCFRICWNTFRSRDRALAHGDIPAPLNKINAEPIARKLADVIP